MQTQQPRMSDELLLHYYNQQYLRTAQAFAEKRIVPGYWPLNQAIILVRLFYGKARLKE